MMDRDNLYYAELAASGEPPNFNRGKWEEFDDAVNNFDQLRFSTIMRKNVNSSVSKYVFGHMTIGENKQH